MKFIHFILYIVSMEPLDFLLKTALNIIEIPNSSQDI